MRCEAAAQCDPSPKTVLTIDAGRAEALFFGGQSGALAVDDWGMLHVLAISADKEHGGAAVEYVWGREQFAKIALHDKDASNPAIAVDGDQNVHLLYTDFFSDALFYASGREQAVKAQVIDDANMVRMRTLLALDAKGGVHLAYFGFADEMLRYGWKAPGEAFQFHSVVQGKLSDPVLAVAEGTVHLAYTRRLAWPDDKKAETALEYTSGNQRSWASPVALDRSGDVGAAALAISGSRVDAFYNVETMVPLGNNGLDWEKQCAEVASQDVPEQTTVECKGGYGVGSKGVVRVSGAPTVESTTTIEQAPAVGSDVKAVVDAQGRLHIAYRGADNQVRYASGPELTPRTVPGVIGRFEDLAVDKDGRALILFSSTDHRSLQVAAICE